MNDLQFSEILGDSETDITYKATEDLIKQTKNQIINCVIYDLDVLCNNLENSMVGEIKGTKLPMTMVQWNNALKQSRDLIMATIIGYKKSYLK